MDDKVVAFFDVIRASPEWGFSVSNGLSPHTRQHQAWLTLMIRLLTEDYTNATGEVLARHAIETVGITVEDVPAFEFAKALLKDAEP